MAQSVEQKADEKKQGADDSFTQDLSMRGRFQQYVTPFTQLVLPMLSLRYLLQALEEINPLNMFFKDKPKETPIWEMPLKERLGRNFAALGMGVAALGVLGFYSKRTYDDMKRLYAGSVGLELNKKPEDVNLYDIFVRSHNKAVEVTRKAFLTRTFTRGLAAASFLVRWEFLRPWKTRFPKSNHIANLPAGVGIMGLYLAGEGFARSPSLFDDQQGKMPELIGHKGVNPHDTVQPHHVETWLLLQRRHLDKHYKWPVLNSPQAQHENDLATRVADLMNQSYNNTPRTGHADFKINKFNYLLGFGLLDKFPESLAFVELANQSSDMKDVDAAAAAIKKGQNPQAVFEGYGIDMNKLLEKSAPAATTPAPAATKFVELAPAKGKMAEPRTHQDFAAKPADGAQLTTL